MAYPGNDWWSSDMAPGPDTQQIGVDPPITGGATPPGGGIIPKGSVGERALQVSTTAAAGGGGGEFDPSSYYDFSGLSARPLYNIAGAPRFSAPAFRPPTGQDVLSDPGYQFRLDQGLQALKQNAAAMGSLRTGGTYKGLEDYAQNYASNEFGNAYNRALQAYDRTYQGAKDMYAPLLTEWQAKLAAEIQAQNLAYQRQWDMYSFGHVPAATIYTAGA